MNGFSLIHHTESIAAEITGPEEHSTLPEILTARNGEWSRRQAYEEKNYAKYPIFSSASFSATAAWIFR